VGVLYILFKLDMRRTKKERRPCLREIDSQATRSCQSIFAIVPFNLVQQFKRNQPCLP